MPAALEEPVLVELAPVDPVKQPDGDLFAPIQFHSPPIVRAPVLTEAHFADLGDLTKLERIEARLLSIPNQAGYELTHSFQPGVYLREILMFRNTLLIGFEHTGEHYNVVLSGRFLVEMNGKKTLVTGPCYFLSPAGTQKVLYILDDTRYMTIHANPDDCRDIPTLESRIRKKSRVFERFEDLAKQEEFRTHAAQFHPQKVEINP